MCTTISKGGQRCASHARPAYEAATLGTPEWDAAAAEFASTPTGRSEIAEALILAQARVHECAGVPGYRGGLHPDYAQAVAAEIALTRALARGEQLREANQSTAAIVAEATEAASAIAADSSAPLSVERLQASVFVMGVDDFTERFEPGEYQRSGAGWAEVVDHPAFLEANPFNPDRIHEGTWDDFVADVAQRGLIEPVTIDSYSGELSEGHHRVVAAMHTGQPVRFHVDTRHDGGALARTLLDEGIPTEDSEDSDGADASTSSEEEAGAGWNYGTPSAEVGEHWSIAQGGDRWHAGGCGAFAIALTERWPHLKIAAEMYHDHGAESVAHAWAYDPATNTRFHIFGAEAWAPTTRPDYDPDSHRVLLDQSAEDVRRLFRGFNTSEDTVYDAMEVVCEQFDPDYVPDPEAGDRNHLYFW